MGRNYDLKVIEDFPGNEFVPFGDTIFLLP